MKYLFLDSERNKKRINFIMMFFYYNSYKYLFIFWRGGLCTRCKTVQVVYNEVVEIMIQFPTSVSFPVGK